jgi:hypothetical protein
MAETEQADSLYQDAQKEYGMKGTIIPTATTRAQSKAEEGLAADIGTRFDIHKPVAHNIVEYMPDGTQKVTRLDEAALARLQQSNKEVRGMKAHPIGYAEAVSGKVNGTAKVAEAADPANGSFVPVRPGFQVGAQVPLSAINPTPSSFVPIVPNRKRTLVKFEGSFGRLSVPYDQVYQDTARPDLLVMVQTNPDGNHFEAPESNDYIKVRIGEHEYLCLSGVQFGSEDRKTHYTVFVIDFTRMQEVADGNKGV